MYIFNLMDYQTAGISLLFISLMEIITVGWIYGGYWANINSFAYPYLLSQLKGFKVNNEQCIYFATVLRWSLRWSCFQTHHGCWGQMNRSWGSGRSPRFRTAIFERACFYFRITLEELKRRKGKLSWCIAIDSKRMEYTFRQKAKYLIISVESIKIWIQ